MARWSLACSCCCLRRGGPRRRSKPTRTVVKFDVAAKAAPKPALRYQLLPEVREMEPGTALQLYLKCFMEQNAFYHSKESEREPQEVAGDAAEGPARWRRCRDYGGPAAPLRRRRPPARSGSTGRSPRTSARDGVHVLLPDDPETADPGCGAQGAAARRDRREDASTTPSAPSRRCSSWPSSSASIRR